MAEIEQKDETPIELKFVDRFITPSFVSGARDPPRKSWFELLSIYPLVTSDPKFGKGNMFGLISVSDKYGSRSDGGSHLYEPDFPYVHLFNFEWCDPIKMRNGGTAHLGNPSSHHSVPFATSIEIRFELYVTSEKKDACFQLSGGKFKKLLDIWDDKSNSKCGSYNVKGEDGRTRMHYILIKDAVDTSMEAWFKAGTHHRVHGDIFAYYGGNNFSYDCPYGIITDYKAQLFSSYFKDGPILLERSFLAVPNDASLIIKGYLVDLDTNEVILSGCHEFIPPTKGCSTVVTLDGTTCSLELKASLGDPPRKSRFELLSICPLFTSDPKFGKGNMFGLISVSDKYGSRSDGGSHLYEPDFPYVHLFNFEWCDPIKMRNGGTVHLGNPSSHHSVPFTTSIEIRFELYVTSEKKDACFQLSDGKFKKKLLDIWDDKSNSKCGSYNVKGEDGRTRMHYILIKDAVDTSMEAWFKAGTHHRVHGDIFTYYGGYLVDLDTNEVILSGCHEFIPPTKGCSTVVTLDGTTCSLELKVNWKY
nr:arginine--tRNA ligase, chloroplastic/mitochondrial [Tanacetum cinerariifolium]